MAELTVLSALKAQVQYPLPATFFQAVLVKRELAEDTVCTKELLESVNFKGAQADCLRQIILFPSSVSEGGMSISKADRASLMSMANRLYQEIGEDTIDERPKITFY